MCFLVAVLAAAFVTDGRDRDDQTVRETSSVEGQPFRQTTLQAACKVCDDMHSSLGTTFILRTTI
jgi:hypothetical protein